MFNLKDFYFCLPWVTPKEEEEEEEELFIPYLNEDIISNILLKFPIESLEFKFRYVCKSWDSIISNKNFRNQHLHYSKSEPGLIIQVHDEYGYGTYFIDMKERITKVQQLIKHNYFSKSLGFSNGLALVEWETDGCRDLRVLNPITKLYLQLPHHQACSSSLSRAHYGFGFAFVSSISKFKVICLVVCLDHKCQGYGKVQCAVLTLDSSNPKWRVIEGPPAMTNCICQNPPISVNGYMYWHLYYPTNLVISMDLIEEKFSEVGLPCSIGNLVEIEGHLSNIVIQPNHGLLEIWILKDVHGGQWVKQHSIICHSLEELCHPTQIVSLRNEEITIFDYGNKMLYVFDVKLKKLKMMTEIKISGIIEICSPHVNSYFFSF
ncbi:hypothetical protein NE237_018247 [Protea cynaroides]|uniref:F-box associated beta-propeller type 3 domain-containing protein n=1 Tax=Protea cynaroides TaxID=273540 RepID=A0A9Q0K9I2_9MAGN|nr:hypothetical protein NE237_018247 [Protea cynaroides]